MDREVTCEDAIARVSVSRKSSERAPHLGESLRCVGMDIGVARSASNTVHGYIRLRDILYLPCLLPQGDDCLGDKEVDGRLDNPLHGRSSGRYRGLLVGSRSIGNQIHERRLIQRFTRSFKSWLDDLPDIPAPDNLCKGFVYTFEDFQSVLRRSTLEGPQQRIEMLVFSSS